MDPKAGSAAGSEIAERLSVHQRECSECRGFSDRLHAARRVLESPANDDARPDSGFASRVAASLPEPASPLAWATVRLLPATTALALVLLGWCWLATPSPSELLDQAGQDELLTWALEP